MEQPIYSASPAPPLIPTLQRLSQSTTRPATDTPAAHTHRPGPPGNNNRVKNNNDGYAYETMSMVARGGKEVWRRSIGSFWGPGESGLAGSSSKRRGSADCSQDTKPKYRMSSFDTSSILYPTLTTHPEPTPCSMLVVSLANIASAPPALSNDEIFQIILRRLEPWVGEEGDGGYVLIIMATEAGPGKRNDDRAGRPERKMPGMAWWGWKWKRIPRKYRKNVKRFYIVHPSLYTRSLLPIIFPLLSPKSYPKLYPCPSLLSLYYEHGVPLTGIEITLPVLEAETRFLKEHPDLLERYKSTRGQKERTRQREESKLEKVSSRGDPNLSPTRQSRRLSGDSSTSTWGYSSIASVMGNAASYIGLSRSSSHSSSSSFASTSTFRTPATKKSAAKDGYWNRDLKVLMAESGGLPPLFKELCEIILRECSNKEGVFRIAPRTASNEALSALLAIPLLQQPHIIWSETAKNDPLLPPKVICMFLKGLNDPVIGPHLYSLVRETVTLADLRDKFIPALPPHCAQLLSHLAHTLHHLSAYESTTKMSASSLATCLTPCLINGPDPLVDIDLCLPGGKKLNQQMRDAHCKGRADKKRQGLDEGDGTVAGLLELWIDQWPLVEGGESKEKGGRCTCAMSRLSSSSGPIRTAPSATVAAQQPQSQAQDGGDSGTGKNSLLGGTGVA